MPQPTKEVSPRDEPTGCLPLAVRLFWIMAGPGMLFFLAFFIARRQRPSGIDIAYLAVVIALIIVRHIDVTRLGGLTGEGEPATLLHWRRFVVKLLLASVALWLLAHSVLGQWMAA